jgi:hypothetical protein
MRSGTVEAERFAHSSDGKRFDVQAQKLDARRDPTDVLVETAFWVGQFSRQLGQGHRPESRFRSHPRSSKDVLLGFATRVGALIRRS